MSSEEATEQWIQQQKIRAFSEMVRRAPTAVVMGFLVLAAVKLVADTGEWSSGFESAAYLAAWAAFLYPYMDLVVFAVAYAAKLTAKLTNRGEPA